MRKQPKISIDIEVHTFVEGRRNLWHLKYWFFFTTCIWDLSDYTWTQNQYIELFFPHGERIVRHQRKYVERVLQDLQISGMGYNKPQGGRESKWSKVRFQLAVNCDKKRKMSFNELDTGGNDWVEDGVKTPNLWSRLSREKQSCFEGNRCTKYSLYSLLATLCTLERDWP